MTTIINHDLRCVDGGTIYMPKWFAGQEGWGNLDLPSLYSESSTGLYPLGTLYTVDDRAFRYAHGSASYTPGRGRCLISVATVDEKGAGFASGHTADATTLTWTAQGTITKNEFAGGYVMLQGGWVRRIESNTAGASTSTITLAEGETVPETISSARSGLIVENKYKTLSERELVGANPGKVVGVMTFDGTADYYFWVQVKGPCAVLATPATLGDADGEQAMVHGKNPGSEIGVATAYGYQVIGHSLPYNVINWDAENFMMIDLCIE